MRINELSLPYPVLSMGDDILPSLTIDCISIDVSHDAETYQFDISLHQEDETITRLITEGKAEYTCEVLCARTYMRRCYRSNEPKFHISLSRRDIFGKIEFCCFVTVKQTIESYSNPAFNEDYDNTSFYMEPGDILAAFPVASYNADLKYDKLYAAGSFMVVQEQKDATEVSFDANDDKIIVFLPTELYKTFEQLHNDRNFNEVFHASIVFNGLFKAILEYNEQLHGNLQWAEAIKYRINDEVELQDYDLTDKGRAYELAQALLKDPYKRMFNHLKEEQEDN